MSRTDKWMPLYVADYIADTMALAAEEHGAYLLLLMDYWRHGPLLDDDKKLAAIARVDRRSWNNSVGPTVRAYFAVGEDGRLHQKRMDGERQHAMDLSAKRSIAGATRRAAMAQICAPSIGNSSIESMADEELLQPDCPNIGCEPQNPPVVPDRSANLRVSAAHKSDSSASQKNMLFPMPKSNEINGPTTAIASGLLDVCTPFARVLLDSGSRDLVHKEERKKESPPAPPRKGGSRVRSQISSGWLPDAAGMAYAVSKRAPHDSAAIMAFVNYHQAHGSLRADWPASWRQWCDHAEQFGRTAPAQKMSMQAELERLSRGRG